MLRLTDPLLPDEYPPRLTRWLRGWSCDHCGTQDRSGLQVAYGSSCWACVSATVYRTVRPAAASPWLKRQRRILRDAAQDDMLHVGPVEDTRDMPPTSAARWAAYGDEVRAAEAAMQRQGWPKNQGERKL